MKIVQDLPWNTEDLKSGREQADAARPCLAYRKRCAKSPRLLETSKWLHNPETDCQDALPVFAGNHHSLLWSLPCWGAAAGSPALARTCTQTSPVLPRQRWARLQLWARLHRLGMRSGTAAGNTSHGEPTGHSAEQDASFLSAGPEPHQCQLQLRVMCKMSTSFLKSATGKCKNLRAAV